MLRFVLSTLALAALLPLTAGAANIPFQSFDIFDPTPRGVIIDQDADAYSQVGVFRYAPNPAFVPDPNYFLFGYDVTDPSKYPFIEADNSLAATNMYEGTGLGEPFNETPLTKASGDESLQSVGLQTVFGLDCNMAGVSGNGAAPDCLFSDPSLGYVAGGGDPLISLGIDGFGIAGLNPGEPGVYTTDYVDVSVGQSTPSIQAGASGSATILALDPNNPASLAQRGDIRYSTASGGLLPGVGANGPQFGAAANPFRVPYWGPGSVVYGSAQGASGAEGLIPLIHKDYQQGRIVSTPAELALYPTAAVAPILTIDPVAFSTPAKWTSDGSIGKVTLSAHQFTQLLNIDFVGSVLQATFDPNDAANLATHGCAFVDMGAVIPAAGCFRNDSPNNIPIIAGPDLIQPWSDWVLEIDLLGGQLAAGSVVGDVRVTGTGTVWNASNNAVAAFDMWQQTFSGPWVDPNRPGWGIHQPIPGAVGGVQNTVQTGTGDTDYFCSSDGTIVWGNTFSLNSPSIGSVPVAGPTFDSTPAGPSQGATSGGDVGPAGGTPGVNGLVYSQKILDLSDSMTESPCHVLQTIPYDIASGVYRTIGPLFVGGTSAFSETLGTGGLREVPEPGGVVLLGLGLAGLSALRRRRS